MDIILEQPPPRVLMFPLPLQGHVTSMLNLAELLYLSGLHVTFLNTDHAHDLLLRHGGASIRDRPPGFVFRTIPDGLPAEHPRSAGSAAELVISLKAGIEKGWLKDVLDSETVSCVIADGTFDYAIKVGDEIGIPVILFHTTSASYFWLRYSAPHLIAGGEDKDTIITSVPGMESFLRYRDLPKFHSSGPSDSGKDMSILQAISQLTRRNSFAKGIIFNTFEHLDGSILSLIRARCNPKIYTVGPLNAHLKERLSTTSGSSCVFNNLSLFEVDTTCMTWLNTQAPKSVIYVSFGSLAILSKDELMEFWHGLVDTQKPFLWVLRPDLLELFEGTNERAFIANWVPQEEVLSHPAVGGFLTHNGWNSTLESIVFGVPMLCWPYFADQQINSRYVGEVWKLGIDMKDVCDRKVVTKMVNDLMVDRRDEFARTTGEMAELAKKSVSQGGSSNCNLNSLIEDIKLMRK